MNVIIDGEAVPGGAQGVAGAIELARSRSGEEGRVVVEISADGAAIPETMLNEPPVDDAGIGSIEFLTADPALLVRETLLQARDALAEADAEQARALELIETGRTQEALAPIGSALGVWTSVQGAVDRSRELVGVDPSRVMVTVGDAQVSGSDCVASLGRALGSLRDAVRVGDWSAMGDTLAEDLPEASAMWSGMLRELADGLGRGALNGEGDGGP